MNAATSCEDAVQDLAVSLQRALAQREREGRAGSGRASATRPIAAFRAESGTSPRAWRAAQTSWPNAAQAAVLV